MPVNPAIPAATSREGRLAEQVAALERRVQVLERNTLGAQIMSVSDFNDLNADGDPYIDQRVVVEITARAIAWHLRYDEAPDPLNPGVTLQFWNFLGGAPLDNTYTGARETTSSTSYVSLATHGPSVTTPLAGDYYVTVGAVMDTVSGAGCAHMSWESGTGFYLPTDDTCAGAGGLGTTHTFAVERTSPGVYTLAASEAVFARYRTTNAGLAAGFYQRRIAILPQRILR